MTKEIRKLALSIVNECDRQEAIERAIEELRRGKITSLKLANYISQGNHHNVDVNLSEKHLPTEVMQEIQEFVILKLKALLLQS